MPAFAHAIAPNILTHGCRIACIQAAQQACTNLVARNDSGMVVVTISHQKCCNQVVMITEDLGTHLAAGRWGSKACCTQIKQQCWNVIYTGNDRCQQVAKV